MSMGVTEQEEIAKLQEENERLKHELYEGRKVQQIIVEKIVPPSDYEPLKRKNQILSEKIYNLQNIIEYGTISTLGRLVEQYIIDSKGRVKKIVSEASVSNFSRDTTDELVKLIKHLDSIRVHLHNVISVQSGGLLLFQPRLRSIKNKVEQIASMMTSLDTMQGLTDKDCDQLLDSLTNMSDFLAQFISQIEEKNK